MEKKTNQLPYWYFMEINCCSNCGNKTIYRERRYCSKPDRVTDRYSVVTYHGCANCIGDKNG